MQWTRQECLQTRVSLRLFLMLYLGHPQEKEVALRLLNRKMAYPELRQGEAGLGLLRGLEIGLGLLQGTACLGPPLE